MPRSLCGFSLTVALVIPAWGTDFMRAGDIYTMGADASGANASYNAAMLEDPRLSLELEFLLRRSRVGWELGEEELTRAILRRAQNLAVSGREQGQTSWLLGLDAFFVKDYQTAQEFFSQVLLTHPDPPLEMLYYLGWSLYLTGDQNAARNVFLNLIDLNQGEMDSRELQVLLAGIEFKASNFATVLRLVKDAASYPLSSWYREPALHLAGYSAYRIDSLEEAKDFFLEENDTTQGRLSLARVEIEAGNPAGAAELYGQLDGEEALYGRAVASYLAARPVEAERAARNYLDEFATGEFIAQTHLLLALIERDRGRSTSAVKELESGIALDSQPHPLILKSLAETQVSLHNYRDAAKTYDRLFSIYPEYARDAFTLLASARTLFFMGETDSAEVNLKELLALTTDEVILNEAHYYLGEAAARKRNYASAAEEFALVGEGSLYSQALKRKGQVLAQSGRHQEAIAAFQAALAEARTASQRENLFLAIEESYLALGIYPNRVTMLKKYVERYPDAEHTPDIQLQIALEYFEKHDCVSTLHELNKLLDRWPRSEAAAEALIYKARCQRRLGRANEAMATYREVPLRFPGSKAVSRSQVELAELLLNMGRSGEALAVYRELANSSRKPSERAGYTVDMARIYFSEGSTQNASQLITVALAESTAPEVAKRAFLLGIRVELALGDVNSARDYAQRYRSRFGETSEYYLERAEVDRASGLLDNALSAYREAASRYSRGSEERVDALIGAAKMCELLGRTDSARRYLEEAALEVQLDRQRVEITRSLRSLE